MHLSIVIPIFNEEQRITHLLDGLEAWAANVTYAAEVLLVSDGSSDLTNKLIQRRLAGFSSEYPSTVAESAVRVELMESQQNFGKGFAVNRGLRRASGNYVLFTDCDLSTPLSECDRLISHLQNSGAHMAIGSRRLDGRKRIYQKWLRDFLSLGLRGLVRRLIPGVSDSQCGFKAYTRDAASALSKRQKIYGFAFDVEQLFVAKQLNWKVVELAVDWTEDLGSKIRLLPTVGAFVTDLVRILLFHSGANGPKRNCDYTIK